MLGLPVMWFVAPEPIAYLLEEMIRHVLSDSTKKLCESGFLQ